MEKIQHFVIRVRANVLQCSSEPHCKLFVCVDMVICFLLFFRASIELVISLLLMETIKAVPKLSKTH